MSCYIEGNVHGIDGKLGDNCNTNSTVVQILRNVIIIACGNNDTYVFFIKCFTCPTEYWKCFERCNVLAP